MKKSKILKRIITMLAVISMVFLDLAGSGIQIANAATTKADPVFKESMYRYILVGKSYDLNIKNKPSKSTYQWKSSNKKVATVNNKGVVKAVSDGSTTISCKITTGKSSIILKAKVYVKEPSKKPAANVEINNMIQSMAVGETYNLNITYTPSDASDSINWTSSDTSVASVNERGVVTALKNGTVTIKAATINKYRSDKITITVSPEVKVSSQRELDQALKAGKASTILISTNEEIELTIPQGDYSGQELIVDAPNAVLHNYGVFKKVTIRALSDQVEDTTDQGGSSNPIITTTPPTPTKKPTPTPSPSPTPTPPVNVDTDDKGFTTDGRVVANFGTPKIDGEIDEIWKKAIQIQPPNTNNAAVQATATFKLLWDDNALYYLAQVNDPNMTLEPRNAHEKDSIEVFLDENNDKTSSYGSDDLQFRVNYGNVQSSGNGDLSRFYTATKTGDGNYIIEARVELQNPAVNYKIFGMDLQVNDAIGTSRAGTITVFDTTDSAWRNPAVFGEVVLTGKKPGDVPGLNPYKLIKLIASAEKLDVTALLFTESLKAAKDVLAKVTATQNDLDSAYDNLNQVITFANAVTKAAKMDLSVYLAEGAAAVVKAVEDAEELLAKEDTTADQMNAAITAINNAIAGLKISGLDKDGNFVAKFGSPVIDGNIDQVWDKADFVAATASGSGSTDTTAKFKALWDDKALYVLADVTDSALNVSSGTVYNRDCVEIFLDEGNNALENIFDLDDTHYRISCENSLSADRGSLDRLYTKVTKKVNAEGIVTGYILEARISLQNPAEGNKIYGFELQLNDAKSGNRTGTLNVFDKTSTAYASPTRFGKLVLSAKADGDVIGFNQYDLLKLVNIANDIQLVRYTDATAATVTELVGQADATIATGDQAQVDALYASLDQAIKALVHKDINEVDPAITKLKEFRRIPADYLTAAAYNANAKGTVARDYYNTYEYSDAGVPGTAVQKNMLVYLPAGYNAEDKNTKYNVLYLIHGTSEDQNTVFGDDDPSVTTVMKKVLDMMIANGELDPMIVVCPTYRGMESGRLQFEMINEIMPFIATKYNTYSASGSKEDLKAARDHHAVGGFSQGSSCTFTIMRSCFDYFKYYLPISGGPGSTDFTSIVSGYAMNDYYVFASTGTDDIAYSGMVNAIPAMANQMNSEGYPIFNYNADLSVGNLYLLLLPGGTHTWQCVNQYLYNILPDVFFAEKEPDIPPIVTDENGFTAEGRIVGTYGTPKIDGVIDEVWSKAIEIKPPHTNNAAVKASATYKLLWDDNALYVLAQVNDPNMTVAPRNAYEQDSIEVFLDEKNDKTSSYGSDDLQFRVNYNNVQSAGSGDLSRFYTATKTGEGTYLIEARVELQNVAANNQICGMELQVNDGIGSSRAGTITLFDTTDRAWSNPAVFGEVVLTGKKPGDVPGLNPYKLIKLIASAEKLQVTAALLTASLNAAKDVLAAETSTQMDMDTAYDALNQVITFVNAVTNAAKMDLSVYQAEGAAAVVKAVEDAEELLAKEDTTADQMNEAIAAINNAIAGLKVSGLDENGNFVAKFGSPVIDGNIDQVWDKVDFVPAVASGSGSTDTTAKFKALWDDKAFYVLADVTDSALNVSSGTVYNRDCVEIFLDEGNNALENIFDLDDTHYRISCENSLSADRGSLDRLYTKVTKKVNAEGIVTGYILEARIALQNPAEGNKIYGLELQLNDAKSGNRTGTLNVFDRTSTAYASPTKFGKVVLSEKADGDVIGFNQYDLLKLVNIANDIQLVRYTDATAATVTELVGQADATIATGDQAQVDALYASLDQAIKALVHKDINEVDPAITKLKEFRRIPADYLTAAAYNANAKGTVARDYYNTYEYSDAGVPGTAVQKNMLVYLPAGYNAEDKNTKYNVLYLIHGTSEDQNTVFGDDDPSVTTVMKKVLDMMIANGELDPMIVVCPTYRGMESGRLQFEMINEIMPFIATKYNTYSASGSKEDLKAARDHHAVGGFSQGSSCTFTIMRSCFDYFKYYLPISGGPGSTDFTSIVSGYAMNDYYVFASTGTDDIAYSGMVNAIPAMANQMNSEGYPIFNYNADLSVGNLYLLLLPGGTHTWQCVNQYLYNILPDVFFAENIPVIKTDENGFTEDGKIVGTYGTPVIDGEIDAVWSKAIEIKPPHTNNAAVKATATFKVLWDDSALYVLAQVNDPNMTLEPGQAHEKDSIEVFLDENNDKTSSYGSDDLQFRVNYGNVQSSGNGDLSRFYTATKTGEGQYLIEARVQLQNVAANDKIYGIELQVNDGIGTSRAGTITLFDTTDSAWRNPAVFGGIVLTGKKPGDFSGMNPYKLMALVEAAEKVDVSGFTKGVGAFTARIEAAQAAIVTARTQAEMDAAYDALNNVMTFMGIITKYAKMNLDVINNGEAVKQAVAAAEDILAKADATPDEMLQASNALDAAIEGIGSYSLKDVYEGKFYIGAAVHLNGLADENYTNNLLSQYNSITAENDMKPEVLLDQAASQAAGEVICNFTKMDQYCDYAVAHGLKMRGHTFVWHSQTPAWFFKEGFNASGANVDVATMDTRLQQFMNQVFGHIKDKYPDLFYAYDVCNEVVSSMSMGSNNWKTVYGDYSYVTKAFEYARNASAGTGIMLYYNDYNEYDEGKPEKILELLADAKAAGNIDGIGMQSHVNIEYPSIDQYRAAIDKYVAAGYDVQITELDIATNINGNGPAPDAAMAAKQAQIYKDLFQCYIDYKDYISSVTLWGINDQHSWRGSQEPLIYDRNYNEKDSYWNIISVGLAGK